MHQHGYIGRKMRLPKLEEKPAIIIATFGTSSRAKLPMEMLNEELNRRFPEHQVFWAYTSEILCRKMELPSLKETLAQVEIAGFRKAVVQPLHIFPGTEYQQMAETCEYFPGLRVFLGETLLHRWEFIKKTLQVVEEEFLAPEDGLNLLALHGTPLAADPANIIYLGLERLAADMYPNVLTASLEGVPDHEAVFTRIKTSRLTEKYQKIKIIPMMYLAGWHGEKDLMGDKNSWHSTLSNLGFQVECAVSQDDGTDFFKGLAHYPEISSFFMERIERSLTLARYY